MSLSLTLAEVLRNFPDANKSHEDACARLHQMINVDGRSPGCLEAKEIRAQFPELFLVQPPRSGELPKKVQPVYDLIKERPGLTTGQIGRALSLNREEVRRPIDTLRRAGLIQANNSGTYPEWELS